MHCQGYSLGLQRVITDLAADCSFAESVCKVQEHYGIEVAQSAVRSITEGHGDTMQAESPLSAVMPRCGVRQMVAEIDGSFIPTVEIKAGQGDKRKRRGVGWREARLCLAHVAGSTENHYGATLGGPEQAGRLWRAVAISAGAGDNTRLHCLGDGAKWIATQASEQFAGQATYLLDFYHVSEYLAAAGQTIAKSAAKEWLHRQQENLKEGRVEAVLSELATHRETEEVVEAEAAVRRCERYLKERLEYLDYKSAIAAGLPIGSGEIEAGHRKVVQARLKLSGAWWKEDSAEKMLALRTCRANREWEPYWKQQRQAQA